MIIVAKVRSTSNAKKGGLFVGKSHDDGGMPAIVVNNGQPIEVEGGEVIINKEAVKKHWKTLSAINQSAGNGVPIPPPSDYSSQIEKMEHGGNISLKAINDGTRIEMEHKDTIKKFKKGNISLESVARSIAKDHLKENPNYYNIISKLKLKKGGSVVCRRCGEDWDESDVENGYTCTSCGCDNVRFYKTGGSVKGLIAPNGKPSNLSAEQYHLVRTAEFKEWFGDWENDPENSSKVIDENGEPLVVYHGTENEFNVFRIPTNIFIRQKGIFFSDEEKLAKTYGSIVKKCFLRIIEPEFIDANAKGFNSIFDEYEYELMNIGKWSDGLIINNIYDSPSGLKKGKKSTVYALSEPSSIKLADGTNTTFDSNNPDIRFENGGIISDEEKESIYEEWKSLVNMSSDELKEFYDSEEGKIAGLSSEEANELGIDNGRKSARWILKMKSINHNDWTPNMWKWAKKQISFIKRMSGVDGDLYNENGKKTPKYLALLIWGNNPEKFANGGVILDEFERLKTLPYNQLLMLIRDSYKDLNAEIGVKGHYPDGEPIIGYLPYQYDFMYTSSKSNKKIRFYIDLGDEYFVHPSELSSKFNPSEQKRIELKADEFKRESDEVFNKIIAELKSNSELEIVKEGLTKALNNGFKIENQYDGNDYFNSFGDSILVKEKIARIKLDKYISRSSDINLKTDINKLDLVRFKDFESNLFKNGGGINPVTYYPKTLQLAEYLENNGVNVRTVISNTNFGHSDYVYAALDFDIMPTDGNSVKFRISDHDVSNIDRIRNELHYGRNGLLPDASLKNALNEVRFYSDTSKYFDHDIVTVNFTKEYSVKEPLPTDEIVSQETTPKGKIMYKVKRPRQERQHVYKIKGTDEVFTSFPVDEIKEANRLIQLKQKELQDSLNNDLEFKSWLALFLKGKTIKSSSRTYQTLEEFISKDPKREFVKQFNLGGGAFEYYYIYPIDGYTSSTNYLRDEYLDYLRKEVMPNYIGIFKNGGEINSDMENIKYTGNIQTDLISVLSKTYRGVTFIAENAFDETDITNAKYLSVPFVVDPDNEDNVFYLGKQFKLPSKKPVNVAWVEEQLNKDSVYKNFSDKFSELLSSRGFSKTSINVYPTSYGIGVAIFFGDKEKVKNSIESLLNEYGIEYKTEYSEAGWVYRYKISKSASNIAKLSQASPKQFKDGGSILTIPEKEKIYSEYKALVNIPSEELASYMNSRDARREALTPAEIKKYGIKKGKHYIKQILILNETPIESWTDENYAKAKEITDFICKFTQENRDWYSVNGSISNNYRALMLFGHDCERYEGGGSIKQNKISKVMHEFREGKLYSSNGKQVVLPKQALAIALSEAGVEKKEEGGLIGDGDCYVIAGKIALNNTRGLKGIDFIGEPYLVHAEVTGQGEISGIRYGHAWIEDNELVYDFSNGNEIILPKTLYYSVARVVREEPKYYRYTFKEAQDKMLSSGHYGYWDLKTETGL